MNLLTFISTMIIEIGVLLGVFISVIAFVLKLSNGMKCQLRSEMLRIYYHNKESKQVRQYEFENFVCLYESYKALKGNSFIAKIYKEVQGWEVIP